MLPILRTFPNRRNYSVQMCTTRCAFAALVRLDHTIYPLYRTKQTATQTNERRKNARSKCKHRFLGMRPAQCLSCQHARTHADYILSLRTIAPNTVHNAFEQVCECVYVCVYIVSAVRRHWVRYTTENQTPSVATIYAKGNKYASITSRAPMGAMMMMCTTHSRA